MRSRINRADDETWKRRADEDAFARLTGLGLLIEAGGVALIGLLAWLFDELSGVEQLVTLLVVSVGLPLAWLFLIASPLLGTSVFGRTMVGLAALAQLALLALLAGQLGNYLDPELGFQTGPAAFDFAAAMLVVLVLTGCLRTLIATRPQSDRSKRRLVSQAGIAAAALCLVGCVAVATADTTGLSCAAFSFDPTRWRSGHRERISDSLVSCDELIGRTRREVHGMLGPGGRKGLAVEHFYAGAIGSDARTLTVKYDRSGHVHEVNVYPPR